MRLYPTKSGQGHKKGKPLPNVFAWKLHGQEVQPAPHALLRLKPTESEIHAEGSFSCMYVRSMTFLKVTLLGFVEERHPRLQADVREDIAWLEEKGTSQRCLD